MSDFSLKCPKCENEMEEGFSPDFNYGEIRQTTWQKGAAEEEAMLGMALPKGGMHLGFQNLLKISAYRCVNCGYLEFYAKDKSSS